MDLSTQLLQDLMEAGYLAGAYGDLAASETIFTGLRAVRPNSLYPVIGLAVSHLNSGNYEQASAFLRQGAQVRGPAGELCRGFLGLSLRLEGRNRESLTWLQQVAEGARDPQAKGLACALLAEPF